MPSYREFRRMYRFSQMYGRGKSKRRRRKGSVPGEFAPVVWFANVIIWTISFAIVVGIGMLWLTYIGLQAANSAWHRRRQQHHKQQTRP